MKVALALGSGGARGYAHIGAIRELEARGHEVVGISGASMGAVVGSLHAAGRLEDFEEWVRGLTQRDVLRLLDVSFAGGGAIRAAKIMSVISSMLGDRRIEDFEIPFTAVATDLYARREVWFTRGPADVAVRASFAIPSVITPAVVGGRLMVDGGVTNPVPLEPLASVSADLVLAVSLTGRRAGLRGSTLSESSDPAEAAEGSDPRIGGRSAKGTGLATSRLTDRFRTAAEEVRENELVRVLSARFGQSVERLGAATPEDSDPGAATDTEELGSLPGSLRLFDVVIQSIEAMETLIAGYRMAGNRPDVLVEIPADTSTAFDFHRAADIIDTGRTLTAEALDHLGL